MSNVKITELTPDPNNANKGTQRGLRALDKSLRQYGAGRSILLDRDNRIIAGNKTAERAMDIGLEDVQIIDSDGTKLIAVRRTDLDLEDDGGKARALATYDNRVGQLDLDWDLDALGAIDADALNDLWSEKELAAFTMPDGSEWGGAFGSLPDEDRAPFQQMTFTLHDTQAEQVKAALQIAKSLGAFVDSENENSNGNALARICETFITDYGKR